MSSVHPGLLIGSIRGVLRQHGRLEVRWQEDCKGGGLRDKSKGAVLLTCTIDSVQGATLQIRIVTRLLIV